MEHDHRRPSASATAADGRQHTASSITTTTTSSSHHSESSTEPPDIFHYFEDRPEPEHFEWPKIESDSDDDDHHQSPSNGGTGFRSFARKFSRNLSGSSSSNLVPYDQLGQDHRELQHQTSLLVHGGRLFHAPVRNPQSVLDLGTGNGTWALTIAELYPTCSVIGTDVLDINPKYTPRNCSFRRHDAVADAWDFETTFDFVHARCLGWLLPYKRLLPHVYDNLAPGGWAEFEEWTLDLHAGDNSMRGTAIERVNQLCREAFRRMGKSGSHITRYKAVMERLGFEAVTERKYSVPWNPWPPGKQDKKIGELLVLNMGRALGYVCMALLPKAMGWSLEATEALVSECQAELRDTRIHAYFTLMTVYGRKPRDGPASPSPSFRPKEFFPF